MKKHLILAASLLLTVAAHAEVCEKAQLTLKPNTEKAEACALLGVQKSATIKVCDSNLNKAEVVFANGGAYDMTGVDEAWKSQTQFTDDESGVTTTSTLTINLLRSTFSASEITTDRRGHRSVVNCEGVLTIK